jgi:DNA-binding NtrC family response regulator
MKKLFGTRIALWSQRPNDLAQMRIPLLRLGCEVLQVESFAQLGQWVKSHAIDLIVTGLSAEDQSAFELITWLKEIPDAPALLVAGGAPDMDLYLEVMRRGAFDCIRLPLDEYELARIVGAAVETSSLRQPA